MAHPVEVVGLIGGECFGRAAGRALEEATVLFGAPRHLAALRSRGRTGTTTELELAGPLDQVLRRIEEHRQTGARVCVLASGDPGFFGIVRALGHRLGSEGLRVHPAPSSVALAFARAGLSWDDALVVSAHGRPLDDAAPRVLSAAKAAVLTSPENTPEALGKALLALRCPPREVLVVSALGEPGEAIRRTDLLGLAAGQDPALSVVILLAPGAPGDPGLAWGLPEEAFEHRDRMITKAEVRAVVLGKLALPAAGVLWDVGAGSGSVGIECARLRPGLRVLALERSAPDADRIRSNAREHGVDLEVVVGQAPEALAGLPDPDRVFVGGGGLEVLEECLARLRPGGVAVATYALLDRAAGAWSRLGAMVQLSVSRAVPVAGQGPRLSAENPVFVCWGPEEGHVLSGSAEQARSRGRRGKGS